MGSEATSVCLFSLQLIHALMVLWSVFLTYLCDEVSYVTSILLCRLQMGIMMLMLVDFWMALKMDLDYYDDYEAGDLYICRASFLLFYFCLFSRYRCMFS